MPQVLEVFSQIAPFFAVVLIGWLAAKPGALSKDGLIDEPGLSGLNAFIFKIALPPLLFTAMSRAPEASEQAGQLVLAWAAATIGLYAVMRLAGFALFGLRGGVNALFGYLSINGNVGFLGLPLIALTLGDAAQLPVAILLSFDVIVMMTGTAILLEAAKARGGDGPSGVQVAAKAFFRAIVSPIPISVFLGFLWGAAANAYDLTLPDFIARLLDLLSQAAAPAALFATGAILGRKRADQRIGEIGAATAAKLFLHPILVALALAFFAPELDPLWVAAGVLAAACPASNNAVLLAVNFGAYELRASAVVLISTALSILTYAAAAAWLQGG